MGRKAKTIVTEVPAAPAIDWHAAMIDCGKVASGAFYKTLETLQEATKADATTAYVDALLDSYRVGNVMHKCAIDETAARKQLLLAQFPFMLVKSNPKAFDPKKHRAENVQRALNVAAVTIVKLRELSGLEKVNAPGQGRGPKTPEAKIKSLYKQLKKLGVVVAPAATGASAAATGAVPTFATTADATAYAATIAATLAKVCNSNAKILQGDIGMFMRDLLEAANRAAAGKPIFVQNVVSETDRLRLRAQVRAEVLAELEYSKEAKRA